MAAGQAAGRGYSKVAIVIAKQQTAAGAIDVLIRPDAATDVTHDEWHTLMVQATTTAADVDAWLTAKKADVEARWTAMQSASNLLASAIS